MYQIKTLENSTLDVDDSSRRVKVALNRVEVKDHDRDIIKASAFDKTIKERGPQGKGLIWHLTDHNPSLKSAVGRFKELYVENNYLVGVTDIPNTTWGNDILELYKTGNINQHSIGFTNTKEPIKEEGQSIITEVKLYEGSAVLWGANENTPTLSVGKSLTAEERKTEFEKTIAELNKLSKLFKTGHLSDECFELLEIKISQLTQKLQTIYSTQPAVEAVEPQGKSLAEFLNEYANNLKASTHGTRSKDGVGGR